MLNRRPGPSEDREPIVEEMDSQTAALQLIAALMLVGAAYLLAEVLVPFVLALILTIALSPAASRLERRGVPRVLSSLLGLLFVASILGLAAGLILYQAGSVIQDSDRYLSQLGESLARVSAVSGGDRLMQSLGGIEEEIPEGRGETSGSSAEGRARDPGPADDPDAAASGPRGDDAGASRADGPGSGAGSEAGAERRGPGGSAPFWKGVLRRNARAMVGWVFTGIGGVLGLVGGTIIFLGYLFYMLYTRAAWVERISLAMLRLGLRPTEAQMERVQGQVVKFLGFLSLVALFYATLVTVAFWFIGIPQPLLWGALAGMLEFIPYFGPLIAAVLPTIVSLTLGTWWQPLAVVGLFAVVHLIEGYVVTPMVYGRAVHIDPVLVLFAALFLGLLWGPLGLVTAVPMLILLRGLLMTSPDSPALDALADVEQERQATQQG